LPFKRAIALLSLLCFVKPSDFGACGPSCSREDCQWGKAQTNWRIILKEKSRLAQHWNHCGECNKENAKKRWRITLKEKACLRYRTADWCRDEGGPAADKSKTEAKRSKMVRNIQFIQSAGIVENLLFVILPPEEHSVHPVAWYKQMASWAFSLSCSLVVSFRSSNQVLGDVLLIS
jgi:hypothetical protein